MAWPNWVVTLGILLTWMQRQADPKRGCAAVPGEKLLPRRYSATTTNFPRGVIRNTSIDAARQARPLARKASR
jgi:hypothetical protein